MSGYFAPQAAIKFFLNLYRTFGPGGLAPAVSGDVPANALLTTTGEPILTTTGEYILVI
jgi:hypothetical protein